jgi:hypothetical protein
MMQAECKSQAASKFCPAFGTGERMAFSLSKPCGMGKAVHCRYIIKGLSVNAVVEVLGLTIPLLGDLGKQAQDQRENENQSENENDS